jgi:mono/diheme cytochrome c family protein
MTFRVVSVHRCRPALAIAAVASALLVAVFPVLAERGTRPWKAPARAASFRNPINADTTSLEAGKAIYARECATCHGDTGRGNGPDAADLSRQPPDFTAPAIAGESDGELFWKLTEGRKPMPRYRRTLSEDDRWNVVNYIRSIEGGGHN